MTNKKTILEMALEYYSAGISVVKTRYKGKCPPKGGEWIKYSTEPASLEQLHEWFGPEAAYGNISAITGPVSGGLTVLDFDSEQLYRSWREKYPEDANRVSTSKSASGYHVFFRSELTKDDTSSFTDIHIKAGGLATLPPSTHETGFRYKWIKPLPGNVGELPLFNPYDWKLEQFTDGNDGSDGKEGKDGNEGGGKGVVEVKELSPKAQTAVEEAIRKTLPKTYGQRYTLLFLFARILKKIDEIKDKSAEELMNIVDLWYERAKPNIENKSITMTRIRFENAWKDAKYPPGEGKSLDIAKEAALNSKIPMAELEPYKNDEIMQNIVRLCFELQRLAGPDDVWFIPTNKAKELFGVSHAWLATVLTRLAKKDKIIKKTRQYTANKCNRYVFTGPSMALLCKDTNSPGAPPL